LPKSLISVAAGAFKLPLGVLSFSDQLLCVRAINARSSLKLKAMQLQKLLQRIHYYQLLTNH
tara:strand:+ start:1751 stop:1936 length:186 start_codon:yes stop_codon:yes gene_type:complete